MKAVIITIGNEILKGRTVNTNFSDIGKILTYSGYEVIKGIIVPDNLEQIAAALSFLSIFRLNASEKPTDYYKDILGEVSPTEAAMINEVCTLEMKAGQYTSYYNTTSDIAARCCMDRWNNTYEKNWCLS